MTEKGVKKFDRDQALSLLEYATAIARGDCEFFGRDPQELEDYLERNFARINREVASFYRPRLVPWWVVRLIR